MRACDRSEIARFSARSRREFLGAAVAPLIIPASALGRGRPAPSERITVGIVGLGSRGFNLLDEFLGHADAQVVALCDVDTRHHRDRKWGEGRAYGLHPAVQTVTSHDKKKASATSRGPVSVQDYREVTERDDVDVVVVATPDHWHALCTLSALQNGKDVYCEKPITHLFHEGLLVCREVAARNAVFQTGSQQRSDPLFRRAVEIVLNGHLGRIQRVEVGLPPGYAKPQGDDRVSHPPEHLDYAFWCGPAPQLPYMRARHHRWWRGHRAFGGGVLMDWIGHHNDIAHWALGMDRSGPTRVVATGWEFPETPVYDSPHHYTIECEYAGGVATTISSRNRQGARFIGDQGWLYVRRGRMEASDARWTRDDFKAGSVRAAASPGHTRNFLDCVRSRTECVAPADVAHRSITPGHLGYVSHALNRALRWDPETQVVINDDDANALLTACTYRTPWTLPVL